MRNKNSIIGTITSYLLGLYLMTMVVAVPWFNWNYAREHGFTKWLFFGEVVPTAKAFIWPYFVYRSISSNNELQHFSKSIHLRNKATNAFQNDPNAGLVGTITEEKLKESIQLMKEGLKEARMVDDRELSKLHPDLPYHYREEFCEGLRLTIQGFEGSDLSASLRGQWLQHKFGNWYEAHIEKQRNSHSERDPHIVKQESDSMPKTSKRWPELTAAELSEVSAVIGKAFQKPLTDEDLERFKRFNESYINRVGRSYKPEEAEAFIQICKVGYEYEHELGRCLLHSIDSKQPFISNKLESLRAIMDILGFARKSKLDHDFQLILSTGKREPYIDEWGLKHTPLTREAVMAGFEELKVAKANSEKLAIIIRGFAE